MNLPLDSMKMEPCYSKVNLLQERLQDLKSRFRFPHVDLVVQRTQNDMQEVGAARASAGGEDGGSRETRAGRRDWGAGVALANGVHFCRHHVELRISLVLPSGFIFLPC